MALNSESEQKSNPVLRVDRDSDSDLQALFDSVLKPDSKRPLQVPLRMRQLPKSFFNPPSTGSKSPSVSHSRENSGDSAFGSGAVPVAHSRAHSSPASLQQTYAAGNAQPQQQPPVHHHTKQRSYDVGSHLHEDGGPLPPGWEQARTPEGQIYYLNHISRTTTWEDPRKTLAAAAAAAQHASAEAASAAAAAPAAPAAPTVTPATPITPATKTSTSAVSTPGPLGPLPDGWEEASTAEGETYFINHAERTTSWFDPRIPQHLQRTPAAGVVLPGGWGAGAGAGAGASAHLQQKLRLQSLQLERERLKQRQLEIRQQEIRQQQELMVRQPVVGGAEVQLDPFLSGLSEHQRQESGDSGLGMGLSQQSYSMPHTPEDFLAAMDDRIDDRMDCTSEPPTPMEASDISITDDDLVPTLQLGEEFTSDILNEVLYRN